MNKKVLRSDYGATSAFKGFRCQTLFIVNQLFEKSGQQFEFQPEGVEDLAKYKEKKLCEIIQVKNYSTPLSLSDLSPSKSDSFLRRSLEYIKSDPQVKIRLVSFGKLGSELENAFSNVKEDVERVTAKLKDKGYTQVEINQLLSTIKLESVDEMTIVDETIRKIGEHTQIKADKSVSFDLLMNWIYQLSETKGFISREKLIEKVNEIGLFLNERVSFHNQFGTSVIPLKATEIDDLKNQKLQEEFHNGVSARYEHILVGADIIRESVQDKITSGFDVSDFVIVHGASGQGKSTACYRHLYSTYPSATMYQIIPIKDEKGMLEIVSTVRGMVKSSGFNLVFYIDVSSNDENWTQLGAQLSRVEGVKVLASIREEDWKRSVIKNHIVKFYDVELNFDEKEARLVFERIHNRNGKTSEFLDFESAWNQFGYSGPLLEFVYLVQKGESLHDRLRGQISRIEDEVRRGYDPEQLTLLRLVSLAGSFGTSVDLKKLLDKLNLKSPKRTLEIFEKEYLIAVKDERLISSVHPIRSKLLTEILCDEFIYSKLETAVECAMVTNEHEIFEFFTSFVIDQAPSKNQFLQMCNFKLNTWEGYLGVIRSLLWFGVKNYVDEHVDVFEEAYEKIGESYIYALGVDIASAMHIDIEDSILNLEGIRQEFKEFILSLRSRMEDKKWIFECLKDWIENSDTPDQIHYEESEITSFGQVIFWLNRMEIEKDINFKRLQLKDQIEKLSIFALSDLTQGLAVYNAESAELLMAIRKDIVDKFRVINKIVYLNDTPDEISVESIIDYERSENDKNVETKNYVHSMTMNNVELLRKIYPEKSLYNHKGFGWRNGLIPEMHDDSIKGIPKENIPNEWLVDLNKTYNNLSAFHFRYDTWNEYLDQVMSIREYVLKYAEELIVAINAYFRIRKNTGIFVKRLQSNLLTDLSNVLKSNSSLPKSELDKLGRYSEWNEKEDQDKKIRHQFLFLQRYKPFRKSMRDYLSKFRNFANQSTQVYEFLDVTKGISNKRKKALVEHLNNKNTNIEHVLRLSIINLDDFILNLYDLQNEFDNLFADYYDRSTLEELREKESTLFIKLSLMWRKVVNEEFSVSQDISKVVDMEKMRITNRFKEDIDMVLAELKDEDIDVKSFNLECTPKGTVYFTYDTNNPYDFLIGTERILEKIFPLFENIEVTNEKRLLINTLWKSLCFIPLYRGKMINTIFYRIDIWVLLNKKIDEINIINLHAENIDSKRRHDLGIDTWANIDKLDSAQTMIQNISEAYFIFCNIADLIEFNDAIDDLGVSILEEHLSSKSNILSKSLDIAAKELICIKDYVIELNEVNESEELLASVLSDVFEYFDVVIGEISFNKESLEKVKDNFSMLLESCSQVLILWASIIIDTKIESTQNNE